MHRIYLSPPDIRPNDQLAVCNAIESGWAAPVGPELSAFEEAICTRIGSDYHAVALNSGTAALHLALRLLNIGARDSVICPTLTFAASANPIVYLGAEPIFVDSEPRTWNLDPELLREALRIETEKGRKPKAVIVVHLYGQCAKMDTILEVCSEYSVPIIEDAAEALGASFNGQPAGSFGELAFFSFNGNKIITSSGGGMLVTSNKEWRDYALYLATQAKEPVIHYEHTTIGYNYRLSNILAALGRSQLEDLTRRIAVKRTHFEAYDAAFSSIEGIQMMPLVDPEAVNYWLTCILIDANRCQVTRDQIIQKLSDADIEARPLWKPLHLQPVFRGKNVYGGEVAEHLFEFGICLPSGSKMDAGMRTRVIDCIRSCFV